MPNFAANLSMMFTEHDFLDRFEAASKAGFKAVEFLFPYDFTPEEISGKLKANGLTQALFNLRNLSRRYFKTEPVIVGEPGVRMDIEVRLERPQDAGADRLVNALGARAVYDGALIIIDSGTATTFDVIAADGAFEGGIIAPGINLSMQALHSAAAKLPRVAIAKPARVMGKDTVSAMQSGVFWGYIDLIDGLVHRLKTEYAQPMTVVATGGVVSLFDGASKAIDHYDADLTIRGLLEVWKLNGGSNT